jgi:hypothetical protein
MVDKKIVLWTLSGKCKSGKPKHSGSKKLSKQCMGTGMVEKMKTVEEKTKNFENHDFHNHNKEC